jgi:hypothetical protein
MLYKKRKENGKGRDGAAAASICSARAGFCAAATGSMAAGGFYLWMTAAIKDNDSGEVFVFERRRDLCL